MLPDEPKADLEERLRRWTLQGEYDLLREHRDNEL